MSLAHISIEAITNSLREYLRLRKLDYLVDCTRVRLTKSTECRKLPLEEMNSDSV